MKVETITEQLFFVTVRVVAPRADGTTSIGTAFIIEHQWGESQKGWFLVSNRHVFEDARSIALTFIKSDGSQPLLGQTHEINITDPKQAVTNHPNNSVDVAALPLTFILKEIERQGVCLFLRAIPSSMISTAAQLEDLSPIEEVIFIGYPNNVYDSVSHLPVARRGTTATPPSVDFNGKPCFLVDASVFPGSSGSPVLIANEGAFATRTAFNVAANRVMLLGLVASVLVRQASGQLDFVAVPTGVMPVVTSQECVDLGVVFKARTIIETVESILVAHGEQLALRETV